MTAQVVNLFETPLILDQLPSADTLNTALKEVIFKRRVADPGVKKSNWFGWQSDTLSIATNANAIAAAPATSSTQPNQ